MVQNGISQGCYISLANLECIVCDPTQTLTMQPDGVIDGGKASNLEDQIYTMRICSTLAKQIYSSCSDSQSVAALGVTKIDNYIDFVQTINGQNLTTSADQLSAVFYSAQFLVSDFDCYYGEVPSIIENSYVGTCLLSYEDCLIPESSNYVASSDSPHDHRLIFTSLLLFSLLLISFA